MQALAPALAFYPAILLLVLTIVSTAWHRGPSPGRVLFLAAWIGVVVLCCALAPGSWVRAAPSPGARDAQATWETAIVFGFGYAVASDGRMLPGRANEELLDWVVRNTAADILIVQEGVWAAVCDTSQDECVYQGRRLLRMHRHDPKRYINTLHASVCALAQLRRLGRNRALVVAHDLQLARALFAARRAAAAHPDTGRIELVAPELAPTSFVVGGAHLQTAHPWLYKPIELLVARPRDVLGRVPSGCALPAVSPCDGRSAAPRS